MGTSGDGEPNGDDVTRAFAAGEVEDPVEEGRALAELENRLFGKPKDDLTISRYRLERKVAEGGFGAVYLARDPELDRPVAVKLLHGRPRSGLDDTEARARLLREAQAMASFSHPNVVAVHDVGTFDEEESTAGPPGVFIVMEYIEGPTIAQWLAAQPRHWRDVLEVFGAAGTGVAAAHAHGLVHRDFKPANVVVASDGRVRVLDFGLARAIDAGPESGRQVVASREATEDSISSSSRSGRTPSLFEGSLTITGTVMGTPAYMAPEQHAGVAANEACDQYAFCVALFEALYGKRPFSGKGSTLVEAKQNERIAEPPTDRAVPGWLFKIVRRGLSANPGARFATMEGLLAALADDPAARRRRLLFTAAGVLAVTLSAFAGYQWLDQRGRACVSDPEAFAGTWDPATKASIRKAFLATQTPFADETWNWVEPTVDDYVDRWNAVRREACEATLVDETEVMAVMGERMLCLDRRLQRVTGVTRLFVGADRAIVERAIETVAALPSPDRCLDKQSAGGTEALTKAARTVVLDSEQVMARGAAMLLAGKAGDAIPQVRTAIEEVRAVDHPPTLARMLLVLADLHESLGEVDDAHATAKEALAVAERAGAEDIALEAMVATITILTASGRHEAADPLVDMASARIARAAKGTDTEATLQLAIGLLRTDQGKFDEAIAALSRGLELRKRLLGPDNLRVAQLHSGLGRAYATSGRYAEAEQHMARSLEISRASFGDEHPVVAKDMSNHANILDLQGRYSEALENYKTALAMAKTALAPDDPAVAIIGGNVGVALDRLGRRREALVHYRNSLALQERIYGTDHPSWALPAANIAMSLTKIGDYEEAITYYRRALSAVEGSQGAESPAAANMRAGLGSSLAGLGRYEEAHSELDRALKTQRAILGPGHPELVAAIQALGEVYMLEGKPKQAIVAFDEALGQRRTAFGDDNVEIAWSYMVRAWALNALGRHDEVVDTLPKQLLRVEDLVGKESPELVEGLLELGVARVAAGATAEGVLDLERAAKICAGGEVTPLTVERVDKALARARK